MTSLLVTVFYTYMQAMLALSAAIFLVSPRNSVAPLSIILLDDSGKASQAAAFSVVIMAVVLIVAGGFNLAVGVLFARRQERILS